MGQLLQGAQLVQGECEWDSCYREHSWYRESVSGTAAIGSTAGTGRV